MICLWLSATLGLSMMSPSTSQVVSESWKQTLVVGHRGAAAYSRENTLPSFRAAIAAGASVTECDVQMSADGVPMVIHDSTLNRTTSLKGKVCETQSSEMVFAGVSTLAQVCEAVKGQIVLAVELKGGDGIEEAVVEELKSCGMLGESMIFASSSASLQKVRSIAPEAYTVLLSSRSYRSAELDELSATVKEAGANAVGFSYANINRELVSHLHKSQTEVFVWTVPPGDLVKQLRGMKVNFIITNHPNEVLLHLRRQ